jgi:dsDNA-specific endonuclease/ATPase MutS2
MNDEAVQFIRHRREDNPDRPNSVQNLWKDNEVFRAEVREAAKVQREASSEWKKFTKSVSDLKEEWVQKTESYKMILKNMRAEFTNRYKEIPGRVKAFMLLAKAQRMRHTIRNTYDLGYYELEALNRIKGAPKISSVFHRRYYYSRIRPARVFGFYF